MRIWAAHSVHIYMYVFNESIKCVSEWIYEEKTTAKTKKGAKEPALIGVWDIEKDILSVWMCMEK